MNRSKTAAVIVGVLSIGLAAASCGSDDDATNASPSPDTADANTSPDTADANTSPDTAETDGTAAESDGTSGGPKFSVDVDGVAYTYDGPGEAPGEPPTGCEDFTIGIDSGKLTNSGARTIAAGYVWRADQMGIETSVLDADLDINKQVADIDQFINEGVDAIVVQLIGDPNAIQAPVLRAQEAGIRVFAFDEVPGVEGIDLVSYQPSVEMADAATRWVGDQLAGKGVVAVTGSVPIPVLDVRWMTEQDVFAAEYPDIELVDKQDALPDDAVGGRQLAEELLAKYDPLDAMFAINDNIGAGMAAAVDSAGRSDDVLVVALNGTEEGMNALKAGTLDANFDIMGTEVGINAADAACLILNGTTPESELPMEQHIETITYTQDNADIWVDHSDRISPSPDL